MHKDIKLTKIIYVIDSFIVICLLFGGDFCYDVSIRKKRKVKIVVGILKYKKLSINKKKII